MKTIATTLTIVISLIANRSVFAEERETFAQNLPRFSLQDPDGKTFTSEDLSKNGLVLVVTAPILRNKGAQEGWSRYLLAAKSGSSAKLAYLEDMQPSIFKGKAMSGMKKGYEPGKEPILLIDNSGNVRRALKVSAKRTVVLVYDGNGKLVYSETAKPSSQAAATIWKKVKLESQATLERFQNRF